MKTAALKAKLVGQELTVNDLLNALRGVGVFMSRESYHRKMRGETDFLRKEINGISKVLGLTVEEVNAIFFND